VVETGVLIGPLIFYELIYIRIIGRFGFFRSNDNSVSVHIIDDSGAFGLDQNTRIISRFPFHTSADARRFGKNQRHRLALHIRTHKSSVSIIVLEEWNQSRRYRYYLLGRDIHELYFRWRSHCVVALMAAGYGLVEKFTAFVDMSRSLCDIIFVFVDSGKVLNFVGYNAISYAAIRCLKESVLVDRRIGCKRYN